MEISPFTHTHLTDSCNSAILAALILVNKKKVLIAEEGGWYSHKEYPKLLGMQVVTIKCDWGKLDMDDLKEHADSDSVLLYSTLGAYAVEQPMAEINAIMKNANGKIIGDISGSIGFPGLATEWFDYAVCSFGDHKPLQVGFGGMLCSNHILEGPAITFGRFPEKFREEINEAYKKLPFRMRFYQEEREKILKEIKAEVAHPAIRGINILVKGQPIEV